MTIFNPHEIIPKSYEGREQAYIKHLLLEGYLERLLYIVGWNASQLGYREVIYVDCFAGPWQDNSNDLSSTSIGISLRLLSKIHRDLEAVGRHVKFKAVYIERDRVAFSRLQQFLLNRSTENVRTDAIHGDFSQKIRDILSYCPPESFAFFFIDPKGWSCVKPVVLHDLLKRPRSEFLINFMYDFVNRTVSMTTFQQEMTELFGQEINIGDIPGEPKARENYILETYRSAIVSRAHTSKHQAMSGYVTILDPTIDRTKYHLIYLTRHPLGIIEFMIQSEKLVEVQTAVRTAAKINKKNRNSGMGDLFGLDIEQTPSGRSMNIKLLEDYWLGLIGDGDLAVTEAVFAKALCRTNSFPSELQQAFKNLIDQNRIINLDGSISRRTRNFIDYKRAERIRKLMC